MKKTLISLVAAVGLLVGCKNTTPQASTNNFERATATLDSIYRYYGISDTPLLRENYPFDADYRAGYLASEEQAQPNPYSYLWPYSGTLSAVSALMETDPSCERLLDERVLPGLSQYLDTLRKPAAYASYVNTAPASDRFYDDNIWLGIDFCDLYATTGEERFLDRARMIWQFIESGMDDVLGGGIYWCEQSRRSKNTCSNAPGAVYALKLYAATKDARYLEQGKALYAWTRERLEDPTDGLYFDNVSLEGKVSPAKFAYNSGQMIQAGVLLYRATGESAYLEEAKRTAAACYERFFEPFDPGDGTSVRVLTKGNVWFSAVMVRGLIELYEEDGVSTYVDAVRQSLDSAWERARDGHGLFETDFTGVDRQEKKWLLTQAAMVEMFARVHRLDSRK